MLTKSITSVKNQLRQLVPYARTAFSGMNKDIIALIKD